MSSDELKKEDPRPTTRAPSPKPQAPKPSTGKSEHFDRKLQEILVTAADVIAERGFHNASIRQISRRTGVSLAGLYYYFENKDELLFLIMQNAFDTALQEGRASVDSYQGTDKLRFFIRNHLKIFIENLSIAKVVVHEAESLSGRHRRIIQQKQRDYFEFLVQLLEKQRPGAKVDYKLAALMVFGMMNWIYTWYDPDRQQPTQKVADAMADIFLKGFLNC